jgi:hypothetical protein
VHALAAVVVDGAAAGADCVGGGGCGGCFLVGWEAGMGDGGLMGGMLDGDLVIRVGLGCAVRIFKEGKWETRLILHF